MNADRVILYAEDDENDAFLFQHALSRADIGRRLVIVPNGRSAIEYLSGTGAYADRTQYPLPSLVLLDVKMPVLSGLDVLKWIRSSPAHAKLAVFMMTSSNEDSDIRRAYSEGVDGYLVKPNKVDDLVQMIRSLEKHWLSQNRSSPGASPEAKLAAGGHLIGGDIQPDL